MSRARNTQARLRMTGCIPGPTRNPEGKETVASRWNDYHLMPESVDRYTCRTPHFHMYSHSTDHTAQMTCVHGSSLRCVPKIGQSSTRHVSPCASQYTEHQHKFSLTYLSCVTVVLFSESRPVVHASICPLGRMVLLRNSTPPQVMSPKESSSTGFWSTHWIK